MGEREGSKFESARIKIRTKRVTQLLFPIMLPDGRVVLGMKPLSNDEKELREDQQNGTENNQANIENISDI